MRYAPILLLALFTTGATSPQPVTHDATLYLTFGDGHCSGTAVGPSVILSAEHCFTGHALTQVNGKPVSVLGITSDGADHVLVRVTTRFSQWAKLGGPMRQKQAVSMYGNPFMLRDLYRRGYVSGSQDGMIFIDMQGGPGDSGSGLFNDAGQLVGVLSKRGDIGGMMLMAAFPFRFTAQQWAEAIK